MSFPLPETAKLRENPPCLTLQKCHESKPRVKCMKSVGCRVCITTGCNNVVLCKLAASFSIIGTERC